ERGGVGEIRIDREGACRTYGVRDLGGGPGDRGTHQGRAVVDGRGQGECGHGLGKEAHALSLSSRSPSPRAWTVHTRVHWVAGPCAALRGQASMSVTDQCGIRALAGSTSCTRRLIRIHSKGLRMKKDIHPEYSPVIFNDLASGTKFLTRSTATSEKTLEWEDGNTYPVIDVEISSASHPFYTGKQRILDSAGRVEKFRDRYKGFGRRS